jgi:predicted GNAT family acetyltransferase
MNENFINKNLIPKDVPEVDENSSEKLDIKFKIATPDDWEECKRMRILSLASDDGVMLGVVSGNREEILKKENEKGEKEWKDELSNSNKIIFLLENGNESIGLSRATQSEKGIWDLYNSYIKKEFQGHGFGKKLFATRLKEIIKHGGKKARGFLVLSNDKNLHIAKSLGAKVVNKISAIAKYGTRTINYNVIEINLTDPEVIKKIDEVLNAG